MDKYLENIFKNEAGMIEKCLKKANITYSIFTFGSCNTSEFGPNSDIDVAIVLDLPESHLNKILTDERWLSGKGTYERNGRKIVVTRWVYGIDSQFASPSPVDHSDFEKWGELARNTRLKYMAKTFKHQAGINLEGLMKEYGENHVPAYEGPELYTICSRDLASGRMDKAILRAVNALHIAAGYDSLNSYSEMLAAGLRLLPEHRRVLEWAYATKKDGSINYFKYDEEFLKNVKSFFTAVKTEIQNFAMEADFEADDTQFNRLGKWFEKTAPGVVEHLNKKPYGYYFADLFVKELLATAYEKKYGEQGFLPKDTRGLLEDVNKNLDIKNLENLMLSADINLVLGKPKEAHAIARNAVDCLGIKDYAAIKDKAGFFHTAARVELGNENYTASLKHYERALNLQPHNRKLWAGALLVYEKVARRSDKANLAKTVCDILDGKTTIYSLEMPLNPEICNWLTQMKRLLKEKIENENKHIQKVEDSMREKVQGTTELKKNLLGDLKDINDIVLERLSDPNIMQEVLPLYKAFVGNKKVVWTNFQEIETVEDKVSGLKLDIERLKWNPK